MERLLPDEIVTQVRQIFEKLVNPVQVDLFISEDRSDTCEPTRQLLEEVIPLSDKLSLVVHDLKAEPEMAQLYKVEGKAPAIVVNARDGQTVTDYGIRYLGVPSGHEFSTLINDLLMVSNRDSGLSPEMRTYLKGLTQPLHMEVFTTPT